MINILLSVRQPFSGLIMDGQKTWELRKNAPRIPYGEHVTLWLYESGKDGERAIIGKCRMVSYVHMRHMPFRCLPDDFIEEFCVTGEHLRSYLPCYAWGVQDPVRLPAPVPLSLIGLTRPPQSWQYISPEQAAILERRSVMIKENICGNCKNWSECATAIKENTPFCDEVDPAIPACEEFEPEEQEGKQ